jgi:hypothetical protein
LQMRHADPAGTVVVVTIPLTTEPKPSLPTFQPLGVSP